MKASTFRRYGDAGVLEMADLPIPEPGDGEVLVRVCATTVSSGDLRLRSASPFFIRAYSGWLRPDRIGVLGMELSGHVVRCAKDVAGFAAGDAVFGTTGLKFGAYAEYACVQAVPLLAHAPKTLALADSAALSYGGISALYFLRAAKVAAGTRVLVWGASGNVGSFAVQLARQMGASVTAVCGAKNFDLVKSLGASDVRDYATDAEPRAGDSFDVILDAVGKCPAFRWRKVLKPGGAFAFVAADLSVYFGLAMLAKLTGRFAVFGGFARTRPGDLAFLARLVEEGSLHPLIDRTWRLEEAADAHRYAEQGHKRGSVLLLVEG